MNRFTTKAIVLNRTDFGEADRIITFLTSDHGKVRGMARGVRKQKSKLAGGIELFSVSDISFLVGRGEILTITSTRLETHYGHIVKDLARTNTAYECIKLINKQTEDGAEPAFFELLQSTLECLDQENVSLELIKLWFRAQLLKLAGHTPNLNTEKDGKRLSENNKYHFDADSMSFASASGRGKSFSANDIKFLRLLFSNSSPQRLQKIDKLDSLLSRCAPLLQIP